MPAKAGTHATIVKLWGLLRGSPLRGDDVRAYAAIGLSGKASCSRARHSLVT